MAAGEECRCGEYIGDEELLDKLLLDGSWQGGWQKERIVERGKMLGRGRSLVDSPEGGSWLGRWQQDRDVELGS